MKELLLFIVNNKEFLALLSIAVPASQFFYTKNNEQKQVEFENYHEKVLRKLSNLNEEEALDSQIAIVFEMRNYPRYFEISKRILSRLYKKWKSENSNEDLLLEMEMSINYMNLNFVQRLLIKLLKKEYV